MKPSTLKVEMFKLLFPLSFPWTGKQTQGFYANVFELPPFKVESLQGWLVLEEAFQPYLLRGCLFGAPVERVLFFKGVLWGWQAPWKNWCSFEEEAHVMYKQLINKRCSVSGCTLIEWKNLQGSSENKRVGESFFKMPFIIIFFFSMIPGGYLPHDHLMGIHLMANTHQVSWWKF